MKLYSLLFTNEAAQTVEGSLGKGIAAFSARGAIVLVSSRRVLESLRSRIKKAGLPSYLKPKKTISSTEEEEEDFDMDADWDERQNFQDKLANALSSHALVGSVVYHKTGTGTELFKVDTSAGVNKFGPLAYQLVMNAIKPMWLKSDFTLKEGSQGVWNKMYELSNQGVYEHRWLGEFDGGERLIREATMVNDKTELYMGGFWKMIKDYNHMIDLNARLNEPEQLPPNPYKEEVFLKFLEENPSARPYSGQFWAYRLANPDPKIEELFDNGNDLLETMQTDYGIPQKTALGLITDAADKFFSRLYHE
jgi:hypothetical protein